MELIGMVAGVITSATIIITACWKVIQSSHKILDKLEDMEESAKQNKLYILKLALFCEDLDMTDRLHAGEQYLALGGNGKGKLKYNQLLEQENERMESEND